MHPKLMPKPNISQSIFFLLTHTYHLTYLCTEFEFRSLLEPGKLLIVMHFDKFLYGYKNNGPCKSQEKDKPRHRIQSVWSRVQRYSAKTELEGDNDDSSSNPHTVLEGNEMNDRKRSMEESGGNASKMPN